MDNLIEKLYEHFCTIASSTVTTDSRNCPKNSIFFALKGESFDGNLYAEKAIENGCSLAIIDNKSCQKDERYWLVDNVLQTLQDLASYHRIAMGIPIIGITGTNGKTTTKELLAAVLSKKYNVLYTQGNLNNHIGVPLTLLNIRNEHQLAIIEMGANHPGEIKTLVHIAAPNAGLITNVGKAHLEGFGDFNGVINTKSELYDFLRETGGEVFLNLDNEILTEKAFGIERYGYGLNDKNGIVNGEIVDNSPYLSLSFSKLGETKTYIAQSNLIGKYNAENIMAAVCVGIVMGVEPQAICDAISNYMPQNNRSQFTKTEKNDLIIDAYNANPTSMKASIENFASLNLPAKMLILGDMRELGADSETEHQKIIDLLNEKGLLNVFLVGECFAKTQHSFASFSNVEELSKYIKKRPISGQTILIKGSNGIKLNSIIPLL